MLAIHGIWAHGVLSMWAEDSDQPAPAASAPAAPPKVARAVRPHPFAARAGLVADVIAEFSELASDIVRKAAEDELTLWLPSAAAGPVPSLDLASAWDKLDTSDAAYSAIVLAKDSTQPAMSNLSRSWENRGSAGDGSGDRAPLRGRVRLSPWQMPALSLDPAAALALLGGLTGPDARARRGIV